MNASGCLPAASREVLALLGKDGKRECMKKNTEEMICSFPLYD
jgi:hypothetical protein